jgi:hypothetical protein
MAVRLFGGIVKSHKGRRSGKGPIDIIEEAVHLLRLMPLRITALYFIGSMPFVLGFLYFMADMGNNAFAHQRMTENVLLMVFLYLWMKCWQALFCSHARAYVSGADTPRRSLPEIIRLVLAQAAIQPLAFITLPVALLITLPFGYAYAFFHNVSLYGDGKTGELKAIYRSAFSQAKLFTLQNHLIIFIIYIFGFFVFLNIMSAIIIIPYLVKTFFGVESSFTMAGAGLLNTTLLAVSLGLCYLAINPIIKTVYVLRCFYGESLHSGEDLKVALIRLKPAVILTAALLIALLLSPIVAPAAGAATEAVQIQQNGPSAADLDQSLSKVINKKEYAWRLPREKPKKDEDGPIAAFLRTIGDTVINWLKTVWGWIVDAFKWIMENIFGRLELTPPGAADKSWTGMIQLLLYALAAIAACLLAVYVYRIIKKRGQATEISGVEIPVVRDLSSEEISADDLPMDDWLALAKQMSEKGDLRLALRALYLGSLANLASRGMVSIARYKSNRDYERELMRRASRETDIVSVFSKNIRVFESIWYGMHDISPEIYRSFSSDTERIMTIANRA